MSTALTTPAPTPAPPITAATAAEEARPGRPLRIQVRLRLRPDVSPSAIETAAARLPAVYAGSVLAGDHDVEFRLACRDAADLTASIAALRRSGAAECQVEVVLRGFLYPQQALQQAPPPPVPPPLPQASPAPQAPPAIPPQAAGPTLACPRTP